PSTFTQGTIYGFYTRQFYDSLYVQASWKVHPRLTLNYGVRWEPYLSPYNNRGENAHFDLDLFKQDDHSTVTTMAPASLVFPGAPLYTMGKLLNGARWAKFYALVGLGCDHEEEVTMTLRATYRVFGDRAMMLDRAKMYFSAPFGNPKTNTGVYLRDPWSAV